MWSNDYKRSSNSNSSPNTLCTTKITNLVGPRKKWLFAFAILNSLRTTSSNQFGLLTKLPHFRNAKKMVCVFKYSETARIAFFWNNSAYTVSNVSLIISDQASFPIILISYAWYFFMSINYLFNRELLESLMVTQAFWKLKYKMIAFFHFFSGVNNSVILASMFLH